MFEIFNEKLYFLKNNWSQSIIFMVTLTKCSFVLNYFMSFIRGLFLFLFINAVVRLLNNFIVLNLTLVIITVTYVYDEIVLSVLFYWIKNCCEHFSGLKWKLISILPIFNVNNNLKLIIDLRFYFDFKIILKLFSYALIYKSEITSRHDKRMLLLYLEPRFRRGCLFDFLPFLISKFHPLINRLPIWVNRLCAFYFSCYCRLAYTATEILVLSNKTLFLSSNPFPIHKIIMFL